MRYLSRFLFHKVSFKETLKSLGEDADLLSRLYPLSVRYNRYCPGRRKAEEEEEARRKEEEEEEARRKEEEEEEARRKEEEEEEGAITRTREPPKKRKKIPCSERKSREERDACRREKEERWVGGEKNALPALCHNVRISVTQMPSPPPREIEEPAASPLQLPREEGAEDVPRGEEERPGTI